MPTVRVVRGSVIDQEVDYIVNAANTLMRGGGGVDGAIHQLAGPKLLLELQRVAPNGCQTGEVVVTAAHELKHKGIVHTPGPIWRGGREDEHVLLANSYRNSLQAVHDLSGRSIAFCSISTGAYRFPLEEASGIAITAVRQWIAEIEQTTIEEVIFAMRGEREYQAFLNALNSGS